VLEARGELAVAFRQRHAVDVRQLVIAQQHNHRVAPQLSLKPHDVQHHAQACVAVRRAVAVDQITEQDQPPGVASRAVRGEMRQATVEGGAVAVQVADDHRNAVGQVEEAIGHGGSVRLCGRKRPAETRPSIPQRSGSPSGWNAGVEVL